MSPMIPPEVPEPSYRVLQGSNPLQATAPAGAAGPAAGAPDLDDEPTARSLLANMQGNGPDAHEVAVQGADARDNSVNKSAQRRNRDQKAMDARRLNRKLQLKSEDQRKQRNMRAELATEKDRMKRQGFALEHAVEIKKKRMMRGEEIYGQDKKRQLAISDRNSEAGRSAARSAALRSADGNAHPEIPTTSGDPHAGSVTTVGISEGSGGGGVTIAGGGGGGGGSSI